MGVTQRALGNIENDKCNLTIERLNQLAVVLEVLVTEILEFEPCHQLDRDVIKV